MDIPPFNGDTEQPCLGAFSNMEQFRYNLFMSFHPGQVAPDEEIREDLIYGDSSVKWWSASKTYEELERIKDFDQTVGKCWQTSAEFRYLVKNLATEEFEFIVFENPTLIGFCNTFDTPGELIEDWLARENAIVKHLAVELQSGGEKVWNTYNVLLCTRPFETSQEIELEDICQDVKRSRKIVACGVESMSDLEYELLPLLPIQFKPELSGPSIFERFRDRLSSVVAPEILNLLLDPNVSVESITEKLKEQDMKLAAEVRPRTGETVSQAQILHISKKN